ncbi:vacuolar histidine transporter YPQ3-like [Bidens hawaiensis]|uniref:vacuolar histidine transporter YPQ3-like n=1 Tax=Bidens hawaiensis TaxID=980011 RepID=UPI00404A9C02
MVLFTSDLPICPANQHCSEWPRSYMSYCLCSTKDWVSLMLGVISVLSWGVAEVPQIIMNYKHKSSEGLAMCFLFTWILGDLFNVFGCLLEPATLPTQYYMAVLYLLTTLALAIQAVYYGYFSDATSKKQVYKIESVDKKQLANDVGLEESTVPMLSKVTPCLQIPSVDDNSSTETVYYSSARSLSSSHTRTASFLHSHRTHTDKCDQDILQEPLLGGNVSRQSSTVSETKNMLCVVFSLTMFLCTYNLTLERNSYLNSDSVNSHNGIVLQVGRKLLQASGSLVEGSDGIESIGIGTFLGWGMAAIYMGGRLPQILLNIRRGHVQGLNPLMFVFALLGNSTYVASILVSSMEWSKIQPNLPWVVEASGCIMLDTFILTQFVYFRLRKHKGVDSKHADLNP